MYHPPVLNGHCLREPIQHTSMYALVIFMQGEHTALAANISLYLLKTHYNDTSHEINEAC